MCAMTLAELKSLRYDLGRGPRIQKLAALLLQVYLRFTH